MFSHSSRILVLAWIVLTVIGCDADPPGDEVVRISIQNENSVTIEPGFEIMDGWEVVSGQWNAESNTGQSFLRQSATDQEFPVRLLREPEFSDLDITLDIRPVSGEADASGGIVFRAKDGANYYVVRANSLEDNFRLYATVAGDRIKIASTEVETPKLGEWHSLRVIAVGDHIQAYLNGKLMIDHRDQRYASGHVGLWTKEDSVTDFRDIRVKGIVGTSSQ